MATSKILVSQPQFLSNKSHSISITYVSHDLMKTRHGFHKLSLSSLKLNHSALWESKNDSHGRMLHMPSIYHPLRTGGYNATMAQTLMKEKPSLHGYVKFLVDSKVMYDALEKILTNADYSSYEELRNTGLERSGSLAKDLEWFSEQIGIQNIPSPTTFGISYASYLEEIAVKNPKAIFCHFYLIYFGLTAGGRMLGKRVQASEKLLENKELESYKWNGELSELLENVKEKLNKVAQSWTWEEKDQCLEESAISFEYSEDIMKLIIS
ncbi:hypothetical protein MKX01_012459 [Papaver californicum]|nr:hypothetical protein MKX01_012459 [Papaver californicum]